MEDNFGENEKRINEVILSSGVLKQLNILYDACKSTCSIITNSGIGSGFFIKLEKNNNPFYCLMSNEHVLQRKMIDSKETIEVFYENQHKKINIKLDKDKRFIRDFRYLRIDITVVEILEEDNVKEDNFLLPNLYYINGYNDFLNQKIYIPQFPKGGNLQHSSGYIIEISKISFEFSHSASTDKGSSGSPIFFEGTNFVIGIHKQGNSAKNQNYANFIGPVITTLKNNIDCCKKTYINGIYEGELVKDIREGNGKFIYNDGRYYIGQWHNDLPNGKGALFNKNDKLIYEGNFVNEKFEGYGKLMIKNGDYYKGFFVRNEFQGQGEYFYKNGEKYSGEFLDGKKHGKGILYLKNGKEKYNGNFVNEKYEGEGRINFSNGEYFIGRFKKGKILGCGELFNEKNKLIYRGEFKDKLFEGNGEYYFPDGRCFIGNFKNGIFEGDGIILDEKKEILLFEGKFLNGKYEGKGKMHNGLFYYIGDFKSGMKNGNGELYYEGKLEYKGDFLNDKYNGFGIYYYKNGNYYLGEWVEGKKHGYGYLYYKNGELRYEGNFIDDECENKAKDFKYDGNEKFIFDQLSLECSYKLNQLGNLVHSKFKPIIDPLVKKIEEKLEEKVLNKNNDFII